MLMRSDLTLRASDDSTLQDNDYFFSGWLQTGTGAYKNSVT